MFFTLYHGKDEFISCKENIIPWSSLYLGSVHPSIVGLISRSSLYLGLVQNQFISRHSGVYIPEQWSLFPSLVFITVQNKSWYNGVSIPVQFISESILFPVQFHIFVCLVYIQVQWSLHPGLVEFISRSSGVYILVYFIFWSSSFPSLVHIRSSSYPVQFISPYVQFISKVQ